MFIDDCIDGTIQVFNSQFKNVFNVGSEQQVSINEMIAIIENIAEYKVNKKYLFDKPKGVMGRSSDNTLIKKKLGWNYKFSLELGLKTTYNWIYKDIVDGVNNKKFTRS
jgi:nucleoside-diphosphate-sugar epimerase